MEAIMSRTFTAARLALVRQFLRFGAVGAVGFLVDTAVVYALKASLGIYAALAVAYVVAATANWLLNRVWTFRGSSRGRMHRQWALYLAANGLGFLFNRGTSFILVTVSPLCLRYPVLAIAGGVAMGMFLNFHLARRFVFR